MHDTRGGAGCKTVVMEEDSYDPSSRFWHSAQLIGKKFYVRGGCTPQYEQEQERSALSNTVEEFDVHNERKWMQPVQTNGAHHPGLTAVACTSIGKYLFAYGGNDSKRINGLLSQLDLETYTWSLLSPEVPEGPMRKDASGMAYFGKQNLAVMCGYAEPNDPNNMQTGGSSDHQSKFIQRKTIIRTAADEGGWTNEIHVFNIKTGKITNSQQLKDKLSCMRTIFFFRHMVITYIRGIKASTLC